MRPSKIRALSVLLGACYCLTVGAPAFADDTEIFGASNTVGAGLKPNILFIVDTSGSMSTGVVTQLAYDPSRTYAGSCDPNSVYWSVDTGSPSSPPTCGTSNHFPRTQLKCQAALGPLGTEGRYVAVKAAMWRASGNKWRNLSSGTTNQPVECAADAGIHGDGVDNTKLWATNGNATSKWTANPANAISWSAADGADRRYVLYSANYMNYYYDSSTTTTQSRLDIVKQVTASIANTVDDVNLGLMRYSSNTSGGGETAAEGGMVTYPVSDIATSRAAIIASINSYQPSGFTPLSETLYEAGQYFAGRKVDYGLTSRINPSTPFPSVSTSRQAADQTLYKSPIQYSCQKNFVVYLTDGFPTEDNSADGKITALPNFSSLVGSTGCDDTGPGRCLDDMAEYLFQADLNSSIAGKQNVITYTIGFGPEVAGSTFLEKVARRGGGQAYTASDVATLTDVLTSIVTNVLKVDTTFTSPSVSVNAFNRTQTLDDLYVSVFRPANEIHWPGNVKKYRVANGQIVDADNNPAIDKGFFKDGTRSIWSSVSDGNKVDLGGAASRLPDPDARNLYTYLGVSATLSNASNAVTTANAAVTDALLGLGAPGLPLRADLIEWIRGRDIQDDDGDNDVTEPRLQMGDPVHAKPAVVVYGGTAAANDVNDAVVYSAENDGYLHAFDVTSGQELWSFVPAELLGSMPALFANGVTPDKHYGLDGDVRVFKLDRNSNGVIEPSNGDKVLLFFGMRRGGSNYYAIDVTAKANPLFKWMLTSGLTAVTPAVGAPGTLPALAETWSTPVVAKVNISGATQNADKFVLIFGGGYEDSQDNEPYNTDLTGNRIYMVDLFSGALLWSAGGPNGAGVAAPDLSLTKMNNSIPADILVLDTSQDGYADRIYATDTGGRIWRFDIANGQPRGSLVAGGILASLGAADMSTPTIIDARRFYSVPDAAIVRNRGSSPYLAIVAGSGYRGHPLNMNIRDRLYMVKDFAPFSPLTQAQYNTAMSTPTYVTDSQLVNITDNLTATVLTGDKGWKLELREGASTWIGEKALSAANIFNNRVFFTTYTPQIAVPADPCTIGQGTNRAYAVSLFNGSPVENLDGQTSINKEDRYTKLEQGGIAPEVVFLFPDNGGTVTNRPLLCLSGVEVLAGVCVNAGTAVRTFWQESGTN